MRGAFISLEGIDGTGKSTHVDFIKNWLSEHGVQATCTREPGGTKVGEALRKILLNSQDLAISARCELLLMFASRMQHLDEVIVPVLEAGKWILCDRFTDATYAYQGGGRGIDAHQISILETWTQRNLQPDLTILFDAPVEVALARQRQQKRQQDRFESQNIAFHQAVRQTYQSRAAQYKPRIQVVNAHQSIAQIRPEIAAVLETFWQQRQD